MNFLAQTPPAKQQASFEVMCVLPEPQKTMCWWPERLQVLPLLLNLDQDTVGPPLPSNTGYPGGRAFLCDYPPFLTKRPGWAPRIRLGRIPGLGIAFCAKPKVSGGERRGGSEIGIPKFFLLRIYTSMFWGRVFVVCFTGRVCFFLEIYMNGVVRFTFASK